MDFTIELQKMMASLTTASQNSINGTRSMELDQWNSINGTRSMELDRWNSIDGTRSMSDSEFLVNMRKYMPATGCDDILDTLDQIATQPELFTSVKDNVMPMLLDQMKLAGVKSADASLRPRGSMSREVLVFSHAQHRSSLLAQSQGPDACSDENITWAYSNASGDEHTGTVSGIDLADLGRSLHLAGFSQISFSDLVAGKVHYKQFLIVRQITMPHKMVGATLLVEDICTPVSFDESALLLGVYNVLTPSSGSQIADCSFAFPLDSIYLILEPFFKVNASRTNYLLRVDNPMHLVRLNELPPEQLPANIALLLTWLRTAPLLKHVVDRPSGRGQREVGNAAFGARDFYGAAAAYTRGIEELCLTGLCCDSEQLAILLSNRAQCMLSVSEPMLAMRDARRALSLLAGGADKHIVKATYRLLSALISMQAYEDAKVVLETCPASASDDPIFVEVRANLAAVCGSGAPDLFDMLAKHKSVGAGKTYQFWLPNFVHPSLHSASIAVKGGVRGVCTSTAIAAGELVVASKAVGLANSDGELGFQMNLKSKRMDTASQAACKWQVLQSYMAGGRGRRVVRYLMNSGEADNAVDLAKDALVNDQFDAARIVDMGRLYSIVGSVVFSVHPLDMREARVHTAALTTGTALFGTASLFNHSCAPNCSYFTLGDMMMVHSLVDIPAGAELTLWYRATSNVHYMGTPGGDTHSLMPGWGFECNCALCVAHNARPEFDVAMRLSAEAWEVIRSQPPRDVAMRVCDDLVAQVRAMREQLTVDGQCPILAQALIMCGKCMMNAAGGDLLEQALQVCSPDSPYGFTLLMTPAVVWHTISLMRSGKAKKEAKRLMVKYAKIQSAGCTEIFDEMWGSILK